MNRRAEGYGFIFFMILFIIAFGFLSYAINDIPSETIAKFPLLSLLDNDVSDAVERACLESNGTFEDEFCILGNKTTEPHKWKIVCKKNINIIIYYNESEIIEWNLGGVGKRMERQCSQIKTINRDFVAVLVENGK